VWFVFRTMPGFDVVLLSAQVAGFQHAEYSVKPSHSHR